MILILIFFFLVAAHEIRYTLLYFLQFPNIIIHHKVTHTILHGGRVYFQWLCGRLYSLLDHIRYRTTIYYLSNLVHVVGGKVSLSHISTYCAPWSNVSHTTSRSTIKPPWKNCIWFSNNSEIFPSYSCCTSWTTGHLKINGITL